MVPLEVRNFGGICVDTTLWPLILWVSPAGRLPDAAPASALEYVLELWRRAPGTKSFMVTDLSLLKEPPPATQRRAAAQFMVLHEELQLRAALGGALVITSAAIRGVITAVFWMWPPPSSLKVFATRTEAILYGLDQLESHGGPLPPGLLELRRSLTNRLAVF